MAGLDWCGAAGELGPFPPFFSKPLSLSLHRHPA